MYLRQHNIPRKATGSWIYEHLAKRFVLYLHHKNTNALFNVPLYRFCFYSCALPHSEQVNGWLLLGSHFTTPVIAWYGILQDHTFRSPFHDIIAISVKIAKHVYRCDVPWTVLLQAGLNWLSGAWGQRWQRDMLPLVSQSGFCCLAKVCQ